MYRIYFLIIALCFTMTMSALHVELRQMSQTPVEAEEARCLIFGRSGLMWVGTNQGVRSYDGYTFKTYRSDAYTPGILPNNHIVSMVEDFDDQLWIGTHDGLTCYNRRKDTFTTYHLQSEQARTINDLFVSSDSTLWVATNAGLSRFDASKGVFVNINMSVGARSLAEDKKGNIYVGTWEGGLWRMDIKSGKMLEYPSMNARNTVASMVMDSKGRLWLGTWEHGIVRLDHPENEKDPGIHRINDGRQDYRTFHQLVEDPVSHSVWGCCIEGLTRVDMDDLNDVENYPILSFCYDMLTDGQGNLWVITRNNGIVHLNSRPSPFSYVQLNPSGLTLPVNRIQTVFTNDGNHFWLGLQPYGLAYYDRQNDRVLYNNHIPGFEQMKGTEGIDVQTISSFTQYTNNEIWVASTRGIVVLSPGETARVLPRYGTPFLGSGSVNAFHRMQNGSMVIGMSDGMGVAFSETKGRMLSLQEDGRDFSSCNVRTIIEDHQHRLWVATENDGIICIEGDVIRPSSMHCHQYASVNKNYPLEEATACYEDINHRLWAISSSGGLFLYDEEKDVFEPVNHRFHIDMGSIYTINGDKDGRIWLSTDKGLVCLQKDKDAYISISYTMEDGLRDIRFSANGSFNYAKDLFYGSARGFFSFTPGDINQWQCKAPHQLAITSLLIDDRPYEWLDSLQRSEISAEAPSFTRQITIPSDIKKFSFAFALLTYMNTEQCHYSYRLKGYDNRWYHVSSDSRRATYQNLPAGTYEFQLRAVDSYGRQVELPYTIKVRVLPPWYQTWWAYLIYFVLLVAAVYGAKEWYKARMNRRARLQQRVNELLHYRELMVMRQFEGARKALEAEEQQHSSADEQFLSKAIDCVKQHLSDSDYDREQFASDMCVSSSTLYNKLRALTDQSVTGFINSIRLKEACRIMRQRPDITITELSMTVGFNTPKYFTKLFKKEFGVLPSEYQEEGEA